MKIAYVEWEDAVERKRIKEGEKAEIIIVKQAGMIVEDNVKEIVLAFYGNHTENYYQPAISIPKSCIKKIRRFTIK